MGSRQVNSLRKILSFCRRYNYLCQVKLYCNKLPTVIFEWRVTNLSDFWVRAGEDEPLGDNFGVKACVINHNFPTKREGYDNLIYSELRISLSILLKGRVGRIGCEYLSKTNVIIDLYKLVCSADSSSSCFFMGPRWVIYSILS